MGGPGLTIPTSWQVNSVRFLPCKLRDGPQRGPGLPLGVGSQDMVLQGLDSTVRLQALPSESFLFHKKQPVCTALLSTLGGSEARPLWSKLESFLLI